VYSLGVILYEILTGKLPFEASEASELARMHRQETPTPLRQIKPEVPEALEEITLKVLSKEPSARYRTADQLGRVLLSFGNLNQEVTGPIILPNNHQPLKETSQPEYIPPQNEPVAGQPIPYFPIDAIEEEQEEYVVVNESIDWITWLLALLAFTTILGLIPFWLYIYFSINP
jgi:serine/threonine-protein kinase